MEEGRIEDYMMLFYKSNVRSVVRDKNKSYELLHVCVMMATMRNKLHINEAHRCGALMVHIKPIIRTAGGQLL